MKRAILIDPIARSVSEIVIAEGYEKIQDAIGCRCFDCVQINEVEDLFIDDEGLFDEQNPIFFWGDRPFAGRGLVLGHDSQGGSVSSAMEIGKVRESVNFTGLTVGDSPRFEPQITVIAFS